jgi:hypothetical protein
VRHPQREAALHLRRRRPRLITPGTGRRPVLTLPDQLAAATLLHRHAIPKAAIAALLGVHQRTTDLRIRQITHLLHQAGHTIQPAPQQLTTTGDPYGLATAHGITTPKIN